MKLFFKEHQTGLFSLHWCSHMFNVFILNVTEKYIEPHFLIKANTTLKEQSKETVAVLL